MSLRDRIIRVTGRQVGGVLLLLAAALLSALILYGQKTGPEPSTSVVLRVEPRSVPADRPFVLNVEGAHLQPSLRATILPDYRNMRQKVGGLRLSGLNFSLARAGENLLLGNQKNGLVVVGAENLDELEVLTNLQLPGKCWNVQSRDGLAVVAALDNGVHLVDITSPRQPRLVSTIPTRDRSWMTRRSGDLLYIAQGFSGLEIFDISRPDNPVRLGGVDLPGQATVLELAQGAVFLNTVGQGLSVVDVSDPRRPELTGRFETAGTVQAMALAGPWLVAGAKNDGLLCFDLAAPLRPTLLFQQAFRFDIVTLAGDGERFYAGTNEGVFTFEVAAAGPVHAGSIYTGHRVLGIAAIGPRLITTGFGNNINIFDVSRPRLAGFDFFAGRETEIHDLLVDGSSIYYTSNLSTLNRVTEYADPRLRKTSSMDAPLVFSDFGGIWVDDQRLYLLRNRTTMLIASREAPDVWTEKRIAGRIGKVASIGRHLLVVDQTAGLRIFDLRAPGLPQVGMVSNPGGILDFALCGTTLLLADGQPELKVVDLTSPSRPQLITRLELPGGVRTIFSSETDAYALLRNGKVIHLDLSLPDVAWRLVAELPENLTWLVKADAERIFVGDGGRLLVLHEVEGGRLSVLQELEEVLDFTLSNGHLVTNTRRGLTLYRIGEQGIFVPVDSLEVYSNIQGLANIGSSLFVKTSEGVVMELSVGERLLPVTNHFSQVGRHLSRVGSYLLVGGLSGVDIVDLTTLDIPSAGRQIRIPSGVADMVGQDPFLYVGGRDGELRIFDLGQGREPREVGRVALGRPVTALDVAGTLAVVAHRDASLQLVDLADVRSPQVISQLELPKGMKEFSSVGRLEIEGDRVFLADSENGLVTIDIADVRRPRIAGRVDTGGSAKSVSLERGRAYVTVANFAVRIYDVTGRIPALIAELEMPFTVNECRVARDRLYLATGTTGLVSLPMPVEASRVTEDDGHWQLAFPAIKDPDVYNLHVYQALVESVQAGMFEVVPLKN